MPIAEVGRPSAFSPSSSECEILLCLDWTCLNMNFRCEEIDSDDDSFGAWRGLIRAE